MNEYIKYFDNLDQAEGYEIREVPFSGYIKEPHLALFSKRWGDIKEGEVSYDRYLFYTTNDGSTVGLSNYSEFPELVDNVYLDVEGVFVFSDIITSIGYKSFCDHSSLTSVAIPNSVTEIGWEAFYNCYSLSSITIPNSVTIIGDRAFRDCPSLTSIVIPDGVTSIGEGAFFRCTSLTSITIPNSVTSIGKCVFQYCSHLTSITIPESVTNIGQLAFYECSSLTSITCKATTPPILGMLSIPSNVTAVYVPAESVDAYKTATNWSAYPNIIQPIL